MILGTNYVLPNEPCLLLTEYNRQSPGSKGFHRYQTLTLMRDDKPYEFVTDLGKAKDFKGIDQFRILGGIKDETSGRFFIEHNAGELLGIAEQMRVKDRWDKRELAGVDKIKE